MQSRWWSLHDVLASIFCHHTFCFFIRQGEENGRGVTFFKPCAVTRMGGLALNFKQNMPGGGGLLGFREEEEKEEERGGLKLFGILQQT